MNARRLSVAVALSAAAFAAVSCALFERRPPRVLEPVRGESPESALSVGAAFVAPEDKAPGFFKKTLGPKGILAVQAVFRNDGPIPLRIHSPNGMDLGAGFEGARLVCGADTLRPLHPAEVVSVLAGAGRVKNYRHPSVVEIVGSPILPPFGMYTLYKEASVGRFYRPLATRSIYPALRGRCLGVISLSPGEEKRGWLYFESPPAGRAETCELLVRASTPLAAPDTIEGYEFEFSRGEEGTAVAGRGEGASALSTDEGYLYALVREGKGSVLRRASAASLRAGAGAPFEHVAAIAAKSAAIADVSSANGREAIALNFASKSMAFVVGRAGETAEAGERRFSRAIRRIFAIPDGTCVVTENGFAHFFDGDTRDGAPGTKLTRGFEDAAMSADRLLVFTEDKGLLVFDGSVEDRFAQIEKRPLRAGARSIAGALAGTLAIVIRGASFTGDTLAFFDPDLLGEIRRTPLAGRVVRAAAEPSSVVLELENGAVVRFAEDPLGSLRIVEAGWLPFEARALKAFADGFVAVGADGAILSGSLDSRRPASRGAVEASARVE